AQDAGRGIPMSMTAGLGTTVEPSITVMHMPLNPLVAGKLIRTVVDTSLHRPDMFELTFLDRDGDVLTMSHLDIGIEVSISVGDGPTASDLITGEVTSIEGDYDNLTHYTVVRGYEQTHRLQKARRSRTFLDSSDGDIARKV